MAREVQINRVVISEEALFDYAELTKKRIVFPRTEICEEVAYYIDSLYKGNRITNERYLRLKYYVDGIGMLMLFLYKGCRFNLMQLWNIVGICKVEDWDEEEEYDGRIREWLMTKIQDINDKSDWVERYNAYMEMKRKEQEEEAKWMLRDF